MELKDLFIQKINLQENLVLLETESGAKNQQQTNEAFSEKWTKVEKEDDVEKMEEFQRDWYLKLYGFENEKDLAKFLSTKKIIIDAGCGLGYKAAWFAELSPGS